MAASHGRAMPKALAAKAQSWRPGAVCTEHVIASARAASHSVVAATS